ncbi:MAG: flagellar hook-associated protein FlgK [Desulfuromonadaceae bacterium]|nr:flagellar hook-associated protein FlgK [Desulfuromonadaceae bacterium]MDD5104069.1 flagellar hook-associated protein FlgK [Desulfuromonadaceae bacterium]
MGLSTAMEIGRSGLNIFRVAQEVTSENIANVNTPGYSRQRVIFETAPPISANGFPMGTGAQIASVERYYDGLLQQQLVNAQTTEGFDTTKSTVLQQVEPTFNEVTNDGLGAAISNYFGAWQDLTLNPAGMAERQTVISRAQILTDNFHAVSKALNDTISIQNQTLDPLISDINATLNNIAQLNGQINTTELVSGNANETRDQRDQLIRDLAKQIGITYTENSDGTTDINYADGGGALVTGATAGAFSLDKVTDPTKYAVQLTPVGGPLAVVTPLTGQLGATLALRDTIVPGYLTQVDTLAKSIVDEVNVLHVAGFDPAGGSGKNFFAPIAAIPGAAAAISLDAALTTSTLAAAQGALLPGDNRNAVAIAQLLNVTTTMGTATFNSYFDSLVSTVGLDTKSAKSTEAQDVAFTKQLTTLRESNSGVSLDEELTNMIKYQRSYQASAKIITTATEMLDTVIGLIR